MVWGFYRQEYRACRFLMEGHLCCACPPTGQTTSHRIELGLGFRVQVSREIASGRKKNVGCFWMWNAYEPKIFNPIS